MNTPDLLSVAVAICPDRDFLIFEDQRFGYEQTSARIDRLAHFLSDLGVRKGVRIGLLSVNCPQVVETYFAVAKTGGIFVPLNFRAKANELVYMINTAGIKVLFVGERYLSLVREILPRLESVENCVSIEGRCEGWLDYEEQLGSASDEEFFAEIDSGDTTILMFTSGTTGRPKAVPLTHDTFTSYILENVEPADPELVERNLLAVPLYHIAGMQGVLAAVYGGRTVILTGQFQAEEWMETVQREKAHRAMLVPTMIKQIIGSDDFTGFNLSSLKTITYGAAAMPLEVIKKAIAVFPDVSFINAFGQTETGSTITVLNPEDHDLSGTEAERRRKIKRLASSIGKPLSDVEVEIVDEAGNPVSPNVVGEIMVRGPRIMGGYWQDEEKTVQAFSGDGWLRTSDMGWMDAEGYLYLAGRADDMIIRGGENISPREVEDVLLSHPKVEDAAVIGIPDEEWGQEPRAVLVVDKGANADPQEIIDFCRSNLASFKCPKSVVFIEKLPRSAMGKLSRKKLVQEYGKK